MADEVMDMPEVDLGTEEVETGDEGVVESAEPQDKQEPAESDSPYTTKFSREMRAALKAWEAANPEAAKFSKQARDNHARLFALSQLEPRGIEGVREKYAVLDGLVRGEAKGPEALRLMQEEMQSIEEIDSKIAAGDKTALEAFGPEFDAGLAKLAPALLDRIAQADPKAYEAAIMPRIAETLKKSDLIQNYNRGIDELNWILGDRKLSQLAPEEKERFTARMVKLLAETSQGFDGIAAKAAVVPQAEAAPVAADNGIEAREQQFHWDSKITPLAAAHETQTFNTLFDPYNRRLKLDDAAKSDLKEAFRAGMNKAGSADQAYMQQMKAYRRMKNPDPATVANFVKAAINRHSKPVMEALIKARYGPFLTSKSKTATTATVQPGKKQGPVEPNVEIRTVKPPMSEIDHRRTPVEWLPQRKYRLYSGKVIQVRAAQ